MNEQTRLLALAHLKDGKKPAEVASILDISYATALKLKKELIAAEEKDTVLSLFNLNDAALGILLESVRKQLRPAIDAFNIGPEIEGEVTRLTNGIEGGKALQQELQESASVLSGRITMIALTSTNAETVLLLSEALCNIQKTFFQSNMSPVSGLPMSSFEQHLRN
jgi:hypothetical protein